MITALQNSFDNHWSEDGDHDDHHEQQEQGRRVSSSSTTTTTRGGGGEQHHHSYLDQTIDYMANYQSCFDPIHYHSFRSVSFLLPLRSCAGCSQRLSSVVFGTSTSSSSSSSGGGGGGAEGGGEQMTIHNPGNLVVQCVACGKFAHRSCGLRRDMTWSEVCPINSQKVTQRVQQESDNDYNGMGGVDENEDYNVFTLEGGGGGRTMRGGEGTTHSSSGRGLRPDIPLCFDNRQYHPQSKTRTLSCDLPSSSSPSSPPPSQQKQRSSFPFLFGRHSPLPSPHTMNNQVVEKEDVTSELPTTNRRKGEADLTMPSTTTTTTITTSSSPEPNTKLSSFSYLFGRNPQPPPSGSENEDPMTNDITTTTERINDGDSLSNGGGGGGGEADIASSSLPAQPATQRSTISYLFGRHPPPSAVTDEAETNDTTTTSDIPYNESPSHCTSEPVLESSSLTSPTNTLSSSPPPHAESATQRSSFSSYLFGRHSQPTSTSTPTDEAETNDTTTTSDILPHNESPSYGTSEPVQDSSSLTSPKIIPSSPPPQPPATQKSSFPYLFGRHPLPPSTTDEAATNDTTIPDNNDDDDDDSPSHGDKEDNIRMEETNNDPEREEADVSSTVVSSSGSSSPSKSRFPFLSAAKLLLGTNASFTTEEEEKMTEGDDDHLPIVGPPPSIFRRIHDNDMDNKEPTLFEEVWTQDGPPRHWAAAAAAAEAAVDDMSQRQENRQLTPHPQQPELVIEVEAKDMVGDNNHHEEDVQETLHFSSHPFASVSRALQENVIAHFRLVLPSDKGDDTAKERNTEKSLDNYGDDGESDSKTTKNDVPGADQRQGPAEDIIPGVEKTPSTVSEAPSEAEVEGLLTEVDPNDPTDDTTSAAHRRLGLATVAGGIAGGMAGLVFAGPVGGVIGAKCGQTAGLLGVLLEGSISIGVLASGIAAGKYTAEQLQDKLEEKRVLAFGEDGTHRRVILVRPNIKTDPHWDELYTQTRQAHRKTTSRGLSFSLLRDKDADAKRERYEREADIVRTGEEEIPTADKVLLLVSRILNDKSSLPGYVYRQLLEAFRKRCEERGSLDVIMRASHHRLRGESMNDSNDDEEGEEEEKDESAVADPTVELYLSRRRDVHAIIKCVTAALQEVRPGFGNCPSMTELTATAVESLVFGEVYDLVIEEIEAEYDDTDNNLLEKIANFERRQANNGDYKSCVSEQALEALHRLPEAHSAVDKLRYCVQFLELISDFFSVSAAAAAKNGTTRKPSAMGADSLLKMVCQHLLLAKVFGINAQLAFLDEFARDEQLLRGREGYALVTFQASLHFLNRSNDFENDIFGQHDEV